MKNAHSSEYKQDNNTHHPRVINTARLSLRSPSGYPSRTGCETEGVSSLSRETLCGQNVCRCLPSVDEFAKFWRAFSRLPRSRVLRANDFMHDIVATFVKLNKICARLPSIYVLLVSSPQSLVTAIHVHSPATTNAFLQNQFWDNLSTLNFRRIMAQLFEKHLLKKRLHVLSI